jgi:hypothetical protein
VADVSTGASRDELSDYLNSPLEKVDPAGVISWWGVSASYTMVGASTDHLR